MLLSFSSCTSLGRPDEPGIACSICASMQRVQGPLTSCLNLNTWRALFVC